MGATPTGATPTGPTLDPLNILVNKFNIATHVALILFLFSSWINYLLYDTKSVMVFWQLLSKIKRFVTIFRISWNGPTLFNIPIGDFPPLVLVLWSVQLWFKGCGMGPWLVLVSPCFRENVVATFKIGSFLCSLDNLRQKNVIVLFLEIKFQNGAHLKKGQFLTYFSHFLVTSESYKNSFSTYLTHIHTRILLTLLPFLPYQFWKKYEFIRYGFSLVWVLVLILIRTILEQSINNKMVSKI